MDTCRMVGITADSDHVNSADTEEVSVLTVGDTLASLPSSHTEVHIASPAAWRTSVADLPAGADDLDRTTRRAISPEDPGEDLARWRPITGDLTPHPDRVDITVKVTRGSIAAEAIITAATIARAKASTGRAIMAPVTGIAAVKATMLRVRTTANLAVGSLTRN